MACKVLHNEDWGGTLKKPTSFVGTLIFAVDLFVGSEVKMVEWGKTGSSLRTHLINF